MRARPVFIAAAALTMFLATLHAAPADRPARRPLDPAQRNAVLALMHAVDLAQETDVTSDGADLNADTLKASNQMAYVPFRVALKSIDNAKSAALYVRAVSREHGIRSKIERSALRDWVERGGGGPAPLQQSVAVGPGEMPVGGAGVSSRRQSIQAAAESSAILALQERELEKEKAAAEAARKKEENHERDPFLFPFEEYYFADVKGQMIDRALMLGAGEYDLFIAVVDRARLKTSSPVVIRRTIDVPDFWNDELRLSSVMLVKDMRQLAAPLPARDQADHPYTFGRLEILPTESTTFTSSDALSV
ncbi:MAG TPA: hypothetical protein VEU08_05235, partial [Vicinamibacterales bacterium]|nr:hypothetical protein [Vicinamibacterales bacterium]